MRESMHDTLRHFGRLYQHSDSMRLNLAKNVRQAKTDGWTISDIARAANVSRATVRRLSTFEKKD